MNGKQIEKLRHLLLRTIHESGVSNEVVLGTITELTVDMWMFVREQDKSRALEGLSRSVNVVMLGKYNK